MNRRQLLRGSAVLSFIAVPFMTLTKLIGHASVKTHSAPDGEPAVPSIPLKPPAQGSIPVAFVISDGAVVIDFAGPWEVFDNVSAADGQPAFHTYTVAETPKPVRVSGGMKVIPNYTFANAPDPKVIVIPAQNGKDKAILEWIRSRSKKADVTMSVCTGAMLLASTGLLSGKAATTHHAGYKELALEFPDIQVKRGARFVDNGNVATSGGLTSGIDLALHIVERYYGRDVATQTAFQLEYQGQGWMNPDSNQIYAAAPISTDQHPLCPVCEMEVDPTTSLKSVYKGKTYYFCQPQHKQQFEADPGKFAGK
jgi:putative intracellular protease/amidase/YHS domain-containing protein